LQFARRRKWQQGSTEPRSIEPRSISSRTVHFDNKWEALPTTPRFTPELRHGARARAQRRPSRPHRHIGFLGHIARIGGGGGGTETRENKVELAKEEGQREGESGKSRGSEERAQGACRLGTIPRGLSLATDARNARLKLPLALPAASSLATRAAAAAAAAASTLKPSSTSRRRRRRR